METLKLSKNILQIVYFIIVSEAGTLMKNKTIQLKSAGSVMSVVRYDIEYKTPWYNYYYLRDVHVASDKFKALFLALTFA